MVSDADSLEWWDNSEIRVWIGLYSWLWLLFLSRLLRVGLSFQINYRLGMWTFRHNTALNWSRCPSHTQRVISWDRWLRVSFHRLHPSYCQVLCWWRYGWLAFLYCTWITFVRESESFCPWPSTGLNFILSTLRGNLFLKVQGLVSWRFCWWFCKIYFLLLIERGLTRFRLLLSSAHTWLPWLGWWLNSAELKLDMICELSLFKWKCIVTRIFITDIQTCHSVCFVLTSLIEGVHISIFVVLRLGGVDGAICYLLTYLRIRRLQLLSERSLECIITSLFTHSTRCSITKTGEVRRSDCFILM